MGNFNRGSRSGGDRGFSSKGGPASGWQRRGFNDRDSRGPAQMFPATCGNCGKSCEVPFRPTNGKPVFCSSCFENNRGSDSRGFENRSSDRPRFSSKEGPWEDRQMFDAVCDNCGNSCKVPFRPSSDKPIYCSNCFEEKRGGSRNGDREQSQDRPQNNDQFAQLNNKLDKILILLGSKPSEQPVAVVEEQTTPVEVVKKTAKKKSPKKK